MSGQFTPAQSGFYGKIPLRGDFVGFGLPRDTVDAWDDWCRTALAASRKAMGEAWLPAWLEAPVWRFALAPGFCGEAAMLGVMLPSVDRAGRHFPLMLAATSSSLTGLRDGAAWLAAAEAIGLAAVLEDVPPDSITARLAAIRADPAPVPGPAAPSLWWTEGAPRLPPATLRLGGLPEPAQFSAMLASDEAVP